MADWEQNAAWWLEEVERDVIYQLDVVPLAKELIGTVPGRCLDLGCGEGQLMRAVDGWAVGTDLVPLLLRHAASAGPVVCGQLPDLAWLRTGSIDLAYAVLVLEHLPDLGLFESAARVVRRGGALVVVANHPSFTAEGAGPIMDPADGEILWRWGRYFAPATIAMPVGDNELTFYHRPLADVLNAAAEAGWMLKRIVEAGFSREAVVAEPGYAGQEQMPRLLGVRWSNRLSVRQ